MTNNKTEAVPEGIDAAAKILAERMDYPWAHMPEKGRQSMREIAAAVIAAAPQPAQPSARLHVGDSKFESWYEQHPKATTGDKQLARDAYAAGMSDPLAAQPSAVELLQEVHGQLRHLIDDLTTAVDDDGITRYVPPKADNLLYSNMIGALIPLTSRIGAALAAQPMSTTSMSSSQLQIDQPSAVELPDDVRRDAERYRLVRRGQHWSVVNGIGDNLRGEVLDAATDAARGIGQPDGGEGES